MPKHELDSLSTCTTSVLGSTGCQQRQPLGLTLPNNPSTSNLIFQPPAETFPACFHQCRAQESPCYVFLVQHLCSGLATLPLSGAVAQVPPGCCSIRELGWLHSYQCVRKVTQSSRIQSFMLQMEYAVFLQECTSEVITLSVNSGELSTSNDRAIICWPLPKIIQQLFQLFCHSKKTLFQFQLAAF